MNAVKKLKNTVLMAVIGGSLILSVGCTKHPNEEQIRVMEETRQAALSAEQKLDETTQMRKQKENELSGSQQKVDKVKKQKAETQARVKNFDSGM